MVASVIFYCVQHKGVIKPLLVFCVFVFGGFVILSMWGLMVWLLLEKKTGETFIVVNQFSDAQRRNQGAIY
jgi:hypothetical protein